MNVIVTQIVNDTLKNAKGKWSRKSLTMFASFIMSIITGVFIILFSLFTRNELNPYAIQVFFGFLALAGGTSALTIWDKMKNNPTPPSEEEDIAR